jgi:hypothetical protein
VRLGHAGRLQWHARLRRWHSSNDATVVSEDTGEILKGDPTVSQESCRPAGIKRHHAGFNANLCRFAEQHGVNASIELFEHMVGGGGGEATEAIGTWRSDRRSCRANERQCRLVSWEAHANRLKTGTHQARNLRPRRSNDGEGSWPEGVCKNRDARVGERSLGEEVGEVGAISDVHDERVKGWTTLRLKDACDRWRIERVRSEAVDRLGGKGDEAASSNDCCGTRHRLSGGVRGARAQAFGDHAGRATSIIRAA